MVEGHPFVLPSLVFLILQTQVTITYIYEIVLRTNFYYVKQCSYLGTTGESSEKLAFPVATPPIIPQGCGLGTAPGKGLSYCCRPPGPFECRGFPGGLEAPVGIYVLIKTVSGNSNAPQSTPNSYLERTAFNYKILHKWE